DTQVPKKVLLDVGNEHAPDPSAGGRGGGGGDVRRAGDQEGLARVQAERRTRSECIARARKLLEQVKNKAADAEYEEDLAAGLVNAAFEPGRLEGEERFEALRLVVRVLNARQLGNVIWGAQFGFGNNALEAWEAALSPEQVPEYVRALAELG